jgi:ABC-type branched-subunit amino acid transport system ATPase component
VANNEIDATKNAGKSTTISTTMQMRRCNAGRIARWSTIRASLEANGCPHWAISHIASRRRRPPLATILVENTKH